MSSLQLYFRLIGLSMASRMQYRVDFIAGALGVIVWNTSSLGLMGILIHSFAQLHGWTFWELVFLYCLWILGHSLYSLFFAHIDQMEDYLIEGAFDQFLLRPASPLIQFFGREIHSMGLADVLIGITGISLACTRLGLQWGSLKWTFFILAILSGAIIELALNLLIACTAFWTGRSRGGFIVMSQFKGVVQQYPVDIFGGAFRLVVTGLIPVAFMNYYPALILLDKMERQGAWGWLGYMSPVVALVLVGLASVVWRLALGRYASSGS